MLLDCCCRARLSAAAGHSERHSAVRSVQRGHSTRHHAICHPRGVRGLLCCYAARCVAMLLCCYPFCCYLFCCHRMLVCSFARLLVCLASCYWMSLVLVVAVLLSLLFCSCVPVFLWSASDSFTHSVSSVFVVLLAASTIGV